MKNESRKLEEKRGRKKTKRVEIHNVTSANKHYTYLRVINNNFMKITEDEKKERLAKWRTLQRTHIERRSECYQCLIESSDKMREGTNERRVRES